MDPFQREVIDRLARIETRLATHDDLHTRVTTLEKMEGRRNALVAALVALPAALAALWQLLKGSA